VRNATGSAIAAISVSGPSFRVTERGMAALSLLVKEAAGRLSRRLGYRGGSES
jgi:DNA-binding IclR family transcriptional regulator